MIVRRMQETQWLRQSDFDFGIDVFDHDPVRKKLQNSSNVFVEETTEHTDYTDFFTDSLAAEADKGRRF